MDAIGEVGRWIAENESLLSGLVSLLILVGFVLSPLGGGLRRLLSGRRAAGDQAVAAPPATAAPSAPPEPPSAPREEREPVLAVLAFDNLSSDNELQYFSDGISEEIIQRLSSGSPLAVR